jgi:glycosyltransferase involved in cell wall biosynthesis
VTASATLPAPLRRPARPKRVLMWHVHGSYCTSLVAGGHDYVVPVIPGRGPDGRGRARTWTWPENVVELPPERLRDEYFDVVVLQRPHELDRLCEEWTGRRPGHDIPAVYLEHNAPQGPINEMAHPARGRDDVLVVHVTHFNDLFWDCDGARTRVVEHGVVDPGHRYTGELPRVAVAINEAGRRARVTGTDLLARFAAAAPIDLFGMGGALDLPQDELHTEMARRRVYLHPIRWTSLGLSLLEAMHLGMPVVALATTEAIEAVPPEAGVLSTDVERLAAEVRRLVRDPGEARARGEAARAAVLRRYGLGRFLDGWDDVLEEVVA